VDEFLLASLLQKIRIWERIMNKETWPTHLVTTEWLQEHLADEQVRIIDPSTLLPPKPDFSLYDVVPAKNDFLKGHIPGARFIDIEHELSTPHERLHFMLPSEETFKSCMEANGISNETMVVTYATTNHWWATRLWWTMRVFNHQHVAVLDGGFQKWVEEKRPVDSGDALPVQRSHYETSGLNRELIADKNSIIEHLNDPQCCLINALRREQHDGSGGVHYGRKGHIVKSTNLPALEHVNADNTFKSEKELRTIFADSLSQPQVITYCGGGIAATSVALILDMLGHTSVRVYDASLTEWAADESLPMEY
jgi:thiosulfate/3-mercaptopyruvate sulfurtransferase